MNRPALMIENGSAPTKIKEAGTGQLPAVAESHPPVVQEAAPVPTQTSIAKLASAIAAIMLEVQAVAKRGENEHFHYKYARMQDILQELTPLLAKHGIVVMQNEVGRSMFDNDKAISVAYQFAIIHKSGEVWPERPVHTGLSLCRSPKTGTFDDKAINKCHTAARKYFLLALFQIPTEDVDDADKDDNDRQDRRVAPSRYPVPSPSGKMPPHAISTKDENFGSWADKLIAFVERAENLPELNSWDNLNDETLGTIHAKSHKIYLRIEAAFKKRQNELSKIGGDIPSPHAQDAADKATGAVPPVSPHAASVADHPDPEKDPEAFLKWADHLLGIVADLHLLEPTYNERIDSLADKMFPPDKDALLAIYAKHEQRLNITPS